MIHRAFCNELQPLAGARRRRLLRNPSRWAARAITLMVMVACDSKSEDEPRSDLTGEELFRQPFPGSNGRSRATCHVPEDNFTLGRLAALDLPPVHPPEHDGPPEALTPEQKSDLIAFLHRL